MRRYDLAYKFIPGLIAAFNNGIITQKLLLDQNFFRDIINKEETDFNAEDFIIEYKILSKEKSVIIYIFPEPLEWVEAKFGLLFFGIKGEIAKYYTLEKSINSEDGSDIYMIGSIPQYGTHKNYGRFEDEPTLDIFLNHIYTRFEKDTENEFDNT